MSRMSAHSSLQTGLQSFLDPRRDSKQIQDANLANLKETAGLAARFFADRNTSLPRNRPGALGTC